LNKTHKKNDAKNFVFSRSIFVHLFSFQNRNEESRLFACKETAGKTPPKTQINQPFKVHLIWVKVGEICEMGRHERKAHVSV